MEEKWIHFLKQKEKFNLSPVSLIASGISNEKATFNFYLQRGGWNLRFELKIMVEEKLKK